MFTTNYRIILISEKKYQHLKKKFQVDGVSTKDQLVGSLLFLKKIIDCCGKIWDSYNHRETDVRWGKNS